jgi:hypothetical protein
LWNWMKSCALSLSDGEPSTQRISAGSVRDALQAEAQARDLMAVMACISRQRQNDNLSRSTAHCHDLETRRKTMSSLPQKRTSGYPEQ